MALPSKIHGKVLGENVELADSENILDHETSTVYVFHQYFQHFLRPTDEHKIETIWLYVCR